jgi:serine/threonine-protein phosphatase 2B catalytic subunit
MVMKGKIKSVARMNKMFSTLREESETLLKLKNMSPDGRLPRGLLLEGKPAIKNALKQFNLARELDKNNEKRPKKK